MRFKRFEHEMRSYKDYLEERIELEREIDDIVYQFAGVRGIRYDKVHSNPSPEDRIDLRYKMEQALKKPQNELEFVERAIKRCEKHLAMLPKDIEVMCRLLFIEDNSYEKVGEMYGYSKNGLRYRIMSEVEKI